MINQIIKMDTYLLIESYYVAHGRKNGGIRTS